jgi:hypothetical protein
MEIARCYQSELGLLLCLDFRWYWRKRQQYGSTLEVCHALAIAVRIAQTFEDTGF